MRRGSSGDTVRALQVALNLRLGLATRPDGVYGAQTEEAVSHAQRRLGLPVTGVADQRTLDALTEYRTLAPADEVFPW